MLIKIVLFAAALLFTCASLGAQEPQHDKVFFANSLMKGRYSYSKASYEVPSWLKHVVRDLPVSNALFFTPGNSLELNCASVPERRCRKG